ncbi:ethanolamine ammonia-lyase light chain EutC [Salmonella enterica subsp. enterica]|nr:ethanolamine ammonia-lyase light chain EutC [Salmonella enterica subsp. enterica]
MLTELRRSTALLVYVRARWPDPRTEALLRFTADHSVRRHRAQKCRKSGSKRRAGSTFGDRRQKPVPDARIGRRLKPGKAIDALKSQCVMNPDVQVVVSDGLSADAITANYEEILPPLLCRSEAGRAGHVSTPFFVRYGRVKIERSDWRNSRREGRHPAGGRTSGTGAVGRSLSATPSIPRAWRPPSKADRTCISNIHRGDAASRSCRRDCGFGKRMLEQKASGISL